LVAASDERVWEEEEGAAVLEAAEQVRASQQLTDEQLGQLVRKTRSYPSSTISWCKHKHSTQQQRGERLQRGERVQ